MKNKPVNIFKIIRIIIVILILTVLILLACCEKNGDISPDKNRETNAGNNKTAQTEEEETIDNLPDARDEVGYAAPNFKFESLKGENEKLSDYREHGKAVIIYFWASWLSSCTEKMEDIQILSEKYTDDLIILAVNFDEKKAIIEDFIQDNGYTFKAIPDENKTIQKKYPTQSYPYAVFINPEGIITGICVGTSDDLLSVYERYIKEALGK